jgi:hypothetical protein
VAVGLLVHDQRRGPGDLARRLRLAVQELGAELDRHRPGRVVQRVDAAADAAARLEHGDA